MNFLMLTECSSNSPCIVVNADYIAVMEKTMGEGTRLIMSNKFSYEVRESAGDILNMIHGRIPQSAYGVKK